jgi:predicted nucleic acid-binding protein
LIVAVDTNVIIAAVAQWHEQHVAARRSMDQLRAQHSLVVPHHALMEAYSVLTRVPAGIRLAPRDALHVIRHLLEDLPVIGLSPGDIWPFIRELANRGIFGGRIYDAAIARAARDAGAEAILTFNVRHFDGEGLQVLTP